MDRRTFLGAGLAALAASPRVARDAEPGRAREPVLRFVHLTDVHVEPRGRAPEGFARALRAIELLDPRPDFILNGGDAIYDATARDRQDTAAQWRVWHDVVRAETTLPFLHVVGNHDVWGWRFRDDAAFAADPRYGKRWALDELGLAAPFYAADRAGWRFLILDSTHPHAVEDYTARLDDAQREWLAAELGRTPASTPVCIVSHIPVVSAAADLYFGAPPTERQRALRDTLLVHTDAAPIEELVRRHPNVRLCLSGHLHMQERIRYRGAAFVCSGAVCGNWWNPDMPAFRGFAPGFGVVDLFADGSWEHAMRTFIS